MQTNTKGCVYFFRHVGLTPIKIGYSEENSPIKRFNTFRTYAPFGSEIVGFIESYNAKELETLLHNKFSIKRLLGEWFEITEDDVKIQIELYSSFDDLENKRNFELAWANKVFKNDNTIKTDKEIFFENYIFEIKKSKVLLAKKYKVTRVTIYNWIKEYETIYT